MGGGGGLNRFYRALNSQLSSAVLHNIYYSQLFGPSGESLTSL